MPLQQDYRDLLESIVHCRPMVRDHESRTILIARVSDCVERIRQFSRRYPEIPPADQQFLRNTARDLGRLRRQHLRVERH